MKKTASLSSSTTEAVLSVVTLYGSHPTDTVSVVTVRLKVSSPPLSIIITILVRLVRFRPQLAIVAKLHKTFVIVCRFIYSSQSILVSNFVDVFPPWP